MRLELVTWEVSAVETDAWTNMPVLADESDESDEVDEWAAPGGLVQGGAGVAAAAEAPAAVAAGGGVVLMSMGVYADDAMYQVVEGPEAEAHAAAWAVSAELMGVASPPAAEGAEEPGPPPAGGGAERSA